MKPPRPRKGTSPCTHSSSASPLADTVASSSVILLTNTNASSRLLVPTVIAHPLSALCHVAW